MRIGVVSDTHIGNPRELLPASLLRGLAGVERILHAGDLLILEVLEQLARVAPVEAVYGNIDGRETCRRLPEELVLEAAGRKIGLFHGHGPFGAQINALRRWQGREPDVIVFGHSHLPLVEFFGGRLLLNPGSPTEPRKAPFPSFAILKIDEDEPGVAAEIIRVE
jgi:hypothetical protein